MDLHRAVVSGRGNDAFCGGDLLARHEACRAACRSYYSTRAWMWERQSLTKARFVAGDASVGRAFMDLVNETIYTRALTDVELGEIRSMRQRIEQERGDRAHPELSFKTAAGGM